MVDAVSGPVGPVGPVVGSRSDDRAGASGLGVVLAGLIGGAGVIHLAMVPAHAGGGSWIDPVAFAVVGWAQVVLGLVFATRRGGRALALAAVVLNGAALGALVWARTIGLPVGSHAGVVEEVGRVDGICAALEVAAICVAAVIAVAPARRRVASPFPAVVAVVALSVATFGLVAPGDHGGGGQDPGDHDAAAGHTHQGSDAAASDGGTHTGEMAAIDRRRCDLGFDPSAYWTGAAAMGVDTYGGGTMAMGAGEGGSASGSGTSDGRGSAGLDRLVDATSRASSGGELDAAGLVVRLAEASDADYHAWQGWMRAHAASGSGAGHAHGVAPTSTAQPTASVPSRPTAGAASAPDDNGGHGGHVGPQPWTAMVDQHQCVQLADELAVARRVALSLPTAADAMAAGYVKVTPYVPGIGAHYMKFSEVDDVFHVDSPEMVLYDGDGPDAHVVGLSYYLRHAGDSEPTQGFTGDNDHYHRHVGLCVGEGNLVIGDSTTTAADCAARGGVKARGGDGWMSHAWVVPGCESPWGVFSGANPILDVALGRSSGSGGGGCAGSGARTRYDLTPGTHATTRRAASAGG